MSTNALETPESRLALQPLDWCAVLLLTLTLILAPLTAGTFANSLSGFGVGIDGQIGLPFAWLLPSLALFVVVFRELRRPVAIGTVFGVREGVLLILGWSLLSVLFSGSRFFCWNTLLTLVAGLSVATLVSRLGRDPRAWLVLFCALLVAESVVALLGIMEYFSQKVPEWRIFGTFTNPDFLAGYLLLGLPLALGAFVASKDSRARLLFGISIALQTIALFLTGSRAGILALAGSVVVWITLLAWCGKLKGGVKPLGMALGLCLLCAVVGFAPLRNRVVGQSAKSGAAAPSTAQAVQATAEAQGHSAAFRRWTWQGTIGMIRSNAMLGAGLGSYEITYPKHTLTAFTAHAHNGYLQWTAETGIPGALFLLFALASLAAFALYVLRIEERDESQEQKPLIIAFSIFQEPRVLLAGLLASLSATLFHSFIDSDWFIVATLLTLPAVLGLLLALARGIAPLATNKPHPASRVELVLGGVVGLLLLWQGLTLYMARTAYVAGATAKGLEVARSQFQSASAILPRDPEPTLILASIEQQGGNLPEAERLLVSATQTAPCGKTWYRLAQFYTKANRLEDALRCFEEARSREPRNVQNLRALGDVYRQAHKAEDAKRIYEIITELEQGVYGKVRAMPEMIEAEFGYAHLGLADIALEEKAFEEAMSQYQAAGAIFGEYWDHRDWEAYRGVAPSKRGDWRSRYQYLLEQRVKVSSTLKRDTKPEEERLKRFLKEASETQLPETEAQGGGAP